MDLTSTDTLKSVRCVVLGAGGFIGTNLCRRLSGRVGKLRAFGRRKSFPESLTGIEWFNGDFSDSSSLALAIEGCDTVFHLVNGSTPASANIDKVADAQSSILPTLRMLEICKVEGVRRVIFVSSGGTVYGITNQLPIDETAMNWPITAYGISKLAIERYLHLYEHLHGLEYRILRVSNPFGPYQIGLKNQGVISAFVRHGILGHAVDVWGTGSARRDYLYIDDVTHALELAISHTGLHRVFNVGSGVSRSVNDVIGAVERTLGRPMLVRYHDARSLDVPDNVLNIGLARQSLLWEPEVDFEVGLSLTVDWMKEWVNSSQP